MSRALRTSGFRTGGDRSPHDNLRPAVLAIFPALLFFLTIAAVSTPLPEPPSPLADAPSAVLGAAQTEDDTVADGTGADCLGAMAGRNALALLPIAGVLRDLPQRRPPPPATRPEASRAPPAILS